MAVEGTQPFKTTAIAGANLSSNQYCFVKLNSSGQAILVASATDNAIGVLQNDPLEGQTCEIVVVGITKVQTGGSISVAAEVAFTATGTLESASATSWGGTYTQGTKKIVGYLSQTYAAASGDISTAAINCLTPVPGT
jgi:hypothetical protein